MSEWELRHIYLVRNITIYATMDGGLLYQIGNRFEANWRNYWVRREDFFWGAPSDVAL
jgi:hypothetical protein